MDPDPLRTPESLNINNTSTAGDQLGHHSFLNNDDYYNPQEDLDGSVDNSDDSCNDVPSSKRKQLREQDRFLPIANIAKIMKRAIPENGKIAKDSRECIQECVSEFISFITSEASDRCHQEKRKTINGEDILFAMCALGFDNYIEPLTLYLHKYRETTKSDRNLVNNEIVYENAFNDPPPTVAFNQQTSATTMTTTAASAAAAATQPIQSNNGLATSQLTIDGQGSDTILYYQNDQSQTFQL